MMLVISIDQLKSFGYAHSSKKIADQQIFSFGIFNSTLLIALCADARFPMFEKIISESQEFL